MLLRLKGQQIKLYNSCLFIIRSSWNKFFAGPPSPRVSDLEPPRQITASSRSVGLPSWNMGAPDCVCAFCRVKISVRAAFVCSFVRAGEETGTDRNWFQGSSNQRIWEEVCVQITAGGSAPVNPGRELNITETFLTAAGGNHDNKTCGGPWMNETQRRSVAGRRHGEARRTDRPVRNTETSWTPGILGGSGSVGVWLSWV